MDIRDLLLKNSDKDYRDFQLKLVPTVDPDTVIGVRVPVLRKIAAELDDVEPVRNFLSALPHGSYDENCLHSILVSRIKDFESAKESLEVFLPYVDNWAVCDLIRPSAFRSKPAALFPWLRELLGRGGYTTRFAIQMMMVYYMKSGFEREQPSLVAAIKPDGRCVSMMVGWYFATALAYHEDIVIDYYENGRLCGDSLRYAVRKALESRRISDVTKERLRALPRELCGK